MPAPCDLVSDLAHPLYLSVGVDKASRIAGTKAFEVNGDPAQRSLRQAEMMLIHLLSPARTTGISGLGPSTIITPRTSG